MTGNVTENKSQPLLFSLEELEACDPTPKPTPRPQKQLKRFDIPKNDNEVLFNLQYEYKTNNDMTSFWKMWELSRKVARNLIRKENRKNRKLCYDDINDKIEESVEMLFNRFLKNSGYVVTTNFITVIYDCMRNALYHPTKIDRGTTLSADITLISDLSVAYFDNYEDPEKGGFTKHDY